MEISEHDTEILNTALTVVKRYCRSRGVQGFDGDDLFAEVGIPMVYEAWLKWPKRGNFVGFAMRRVEWRINSALKQRKRLKEEQINLKRGYSTVDAPSGRMLVIWKQIAYGDARKKIAAKRKISTRTVDYYIREIKRMLDLDYHVGLGAVGRIWGERNPV